LGSASKWLANDCCSWGPARSPMLLVAVGGRKRPRPEPLAHPFNRRNNASTFSKVLP
jgi:hypothetical protein